MNIGIRTWRIEDSPNLTRALNNKKILDSLRDGIPFPYLVSDAESFITAMLSSDREATYDMKTLLLDSGKTITSFVATKLLSAQIKP